MPPKKAQKAKRTLKVPTPKPPPIRLWRVSVPCPSWARFPRAPRNRCACSPVRRFAWPPGRCGVTRLRPRSVHSSGSTASASVGSGAPVATRTAWRGCRRSGFCDPAGTSPTTGRARSRATGGSAGASESAPSVPSSPSGPSGPSLVASRRSGRRNPAEPPTSTARTAKPSTAACGKPGTWVVEVTSSAHIRPRASVSATRIGSGATAASTTAASWSSTLRIACAPFVRCYALVSA